jgi:hypothetical protein
VRKSWRRTFPREKITLARHPCRTRTLPSICVRAQNGARLGGDRVAARGDGRCAALFPGWGGDSAPWGLVGTTSRGAAMPAGPFHEYFLLPHLCCLFVGLVGADRLTRRRWSPSQASVVTRWEERRPRRLPRSCRVPLACYLVDMYQTFDMIRNLGHPRGRATLSTRRIAGSHSKAPGRLRARLFPSGIGVAAHAHR